MAGICMVNSWVSCHAFLKLPSDRKHEWEGVSHRALISNRGGAMQRERG